MVFSGIPFLLSFLFVTRITNDVSMLSDGWGVREASVCLHISTVGLVVLVLA